MGRAALGCRFLGVASCLDLISVLILLVSGHLYCQTFWGVVRSVIFCGRIVLIVLLESNSTCSSAHEDSDAYHYAGFCISHITLDWAGRCWAGGWLGNGM